MTGITDPSQEYFKNGLWAWVSTAWKKLVADASNFLQVNIAAQDIDVEVKQQAAADLTPGIMGWDGSAWHKLPIVWGYSDRWAESVYEGTATAGLDTLTTVVVPVGYIYVLQAAGTLNVNTANSRIVLRVVGSGIDCPAYTWTTPAANVWNTWQGTIMLKAGDYVYVPFFVCVAGDDLHLRVWGYKMKVAE